MARGRFAPEGTPVLTCLGVTRRCVPSTCKSLDGIAFLRLRQMACDSETVRVLSCEVRMPNS